MTPTSRPEPELAALREALKAADPLHPGGDTFVVTPKKLAGVLAKRGYALRAAAQRPDVRGLREAVAHYVALHRPDGVCNGKCSAWAALAAADRDSREGGDEATEGPFDWEQWTPDERIRRGRMGRQGAVLDFGPRPSSPFAVFHSDTEEEGARLAALVQKRLQLAALAVPVDEALRTARLRWQTELLYIDKTLQAASSKDWASNGHVPIWAREDRRTIQRLIGEMELLRPPAAAPETEDER